MVIIEKDIDKLTPEQRDVAKQLIEKYRLKEAEINEQYEKAILECQMKLQLLKLQMLEERTNLAEQLSSEFDKAGI